MAEINTLNDLIDNFNKLLNKEVKKLEEQPEEVKQKPIEQPTKEFNLTDDIYVIDENSYYLTDMVKDIKTSGITEITFTHNDGDFVVPGITEDQLLTVLLYKNRNNGRRYNLIKQLLSY